MEKDTAKDKSTNKNKAKSHGADSSLFADAKAKTDVGKESPAPAFTVSDDIKDKPERGATPKHSRVVLQLKDDGAVDWSATKPAYKDTLRAVVKNDPSLGNFIAQAGGNHETGILIADDLALLTVNSIMSVDAVCFSTLGSRINPFLKFVPLPVSLAACTVSKEEMQKAEMMQPVKRIMSKYGPGFLFKYQDEVMVAKFILEMSMVKFNHCVAIGMQIAQQMEAQKNPQPIQHVNGVDKTTQTETPKIDLDNIGSAELKTQ